MQGFRFDQFSPPELQRLCHLRAIEWVVWPAFLSQPLLPLLYTFMPVYEGLLLVFIVSVLWGFPVHCLPWIEELQASDVKLTWFDGDIFRAREQFEKRGTKGTMQNFYRQLGEIQEAGFPETLRDYTLVRSLLASGKFLTASEVERKVFG